jgi:hypothetical protein
MLGKGRGCGDRLGTIKEETLGRSIDDRGMDGDAS